MAEWTLTDGSGKMAFSNCNTEEGTGWIPFTDRIGYNCVSVCMRARACVCVCVCVCMSFCVSILCVYVCVAYVLMPYLIHLVSSVCECVQRYLSVSLIWSVLSDCLSCGPLCVSVRLF